MKVYQLRADANRFQNLTVSISDEWDRLRNDFSGKPISPNAEPYKVKLLVDDKYVGRLPSDFPSLASNVPVFSGRAVKVLDNYLNDNGELISLHYENYYAYNVLRVVDALDLNESKVIYFKDSERILDVEEFVFRPDVIHDLKIFKLPKLLSSWPFVNEAFATRVNNAKLTGFWFKQVFSY